MQVNIVNDRWNVSAFCDVPDDFGHNKISLFYIILKFYENDFLSDSNSFYK